MFLSYLYLKLTLANISQTMLLVRSEMHNRSVGFSQVHLFSRFLCIPAVWLILPTAMRLTTGLTKNEAINVICHREICEESCEEKGCSREEQH